MSVLLLLKLYSRGWDDLGITRDEKEVEAIKEAVSKLETAHEILLKPNNVHVSFDNNKWGNYLCLKPIRVRDYAAEIIESVGEAHIPLGYHSRHRHIPTWLGSGEPEDSLCEHNQVTISN